MRDARNKGGSPRRKDLLCGVISFVAPSLTRVVICVSRAFCWTDQEKRETACSLHKASLVFGNFSTTQELKRGKNWHFFKLCNTFPS